MEFTKPSADGFTVYSKSGCVNCNIVKKQIKEKNFLMNEINCDEYILEDKEGFLKFVENLTGISHKTFPIVFYEKKYIGGLIDTSNYIEKLMLSFEDNF